MTKNSLSPNKSKKSNSASKKKLTNNLNKTPNQTYYSVGIEMRYILGTISNVLQNFELLDKIDASIIISL